MTGPYVTDEIEYYRNDAQDPHDPVWETDANIAAMERVDDPSTPENEAPLELRNAGGVLEFIEGILEETASFLEVDSPIPDKKIKMDSIRTRELGSDKWRGQQRQVTAEVKKILEESPKRRRATLVNYGPNIVYLSPLPPGGGLVTFPQPNQVSLLVSGAAFWAPLVVETKDDFYAVCAPTQTGRVEIIEEFDFES